MTIYAPDYWLILDTGQTKKVFASWLGGFMNGPSWKLSSGTKEIIDGESHWILPQESGSIYQLHKDCEGSSGWHQVVLQKFLDAYPQLSVVSIAPDGTFTKKEENEDVSSMEG